MVPNSNDDKVRKILKKINSYFEPLYIPVVLESYAKINECFPNVERKITLDGGSIVYGWQIWKTNLICEAEFHAVWKSKDGDLVDITPKNPPVETILFIQDNKIRYNGSQIDNIRINNTNNTLVNDLIDIYKALYKVRNRGERAFSYQIKFNREEAIVYKNLEKFSLILQQFIYQGGQIGSHCFCGSRRNYSDCHRNELDRLIMLSKTF